MREDRLVSLVAASGRQVGRHAESTPWRAGLTRQFQKAGLDVVWVSEAYGLDAVSRLAYLAAKTERLLIGTSILPIFSRTPALLAQTAAGLENSAGPPSGRN